MKNLLLIDQIIPIGLTSLILMLIAILIIVIIIASAIRVVREYERSVIFRLGRCIGAKGPGVVFLIPFIDRPVVVDLRERYLEVSRQTCITKDNAPVDIDFLIYYKVVDPLMSTLQVRNFEGAAVGMATTILRAVVGDIMLDDVLARREEINRVLRLKLDEVTERWGIKVSSVEIREILPPRDVQDAMIKQMAAERNKRAMILEAEGKRESAIKVAEGERQANILKAEGERQASILRAEGYAQALETIFKAASRLDYKTMSLQYLETLKSLGQSPATKFIFPMEFSELITPIRRFLSEVEGSIKSESSKEVKQS
ncbi:MAG: SPFH/Band 7/PHB domain protein [Candidatus Methanomethylicia archaeon]|nr:SPFH/Band 7/PHB domain protein [Candidatus Methanomethylicia archaeon]MCX8168823.1 SPFH/Band 7/PHB domain protein [Candidatus Methanomethylicia archaeon]MDW7988555.1 SPFH domain-containing protein [Nitrososphaerota archaeon]